MPLWEEASSPTQTLSPDSGYTATATAQSGDFTYTSSNGEVTITGYTGAAVTVDIPGQIDGLPVRVIGASAFSGKASLTSVTIPSSVATIGGSAFFRCTSLASVTIPAGVTSIGSSAFYYCTSLTSMTIPAGVTSIGSSAFSSCTSLTSVTIPSTVTTIGSSAFYNCISLQTITIPVGVTRIYPNTFYNCRGLTSVSIPASVTSIESEAFYVCTGLTSVTLPADLKTIGVSAFSNCAGLVSITLPPSLTLIDNNAFFNCASLRSITIPGSVGNIGSYVFSGCTALANATIQPRSGLYASKIENNMFSNCTSLASVTIPLGVTAVGESAFANCRGLTSVVLPASLTTVGRSAFQYCTTLTDITLNAQSMTLEANAFSNCSSLKNIYAWGNAPSTNPSAFSSSPITVNRRGGTSGWSESLAGAPVILFQSEYSYTVVSYELTITGYTGAGGAATIPEQIPTEFGVLPVTLIGNNAFSGKTKVTNLAIPTSVRSIGNSAFRGCTGLTNVTIPVSVTTIGSAAFSGCTLLAAIAVDATNPAYTSVDGVVYDKSLSTLIQYPAGRTGSVVLPVAITSIGSSAFSGCSGLTSVVIPDSVTSIGSSAFSSCSSLTSVIIPDSLTSIGDSAFNGCTRITSLTLPNGLATIGEWAFEYCVGIKSIVIPASVMSIGGAAFRTCTRLPAISVDAGNQAYASIDGVVYDKLLSTLIICPAGKAGSLVIPTTVTSISFSAFYFCPLLTSVYFLDTPPTLAAGTLDRYYWSHQRFTIYRFSPAAGWSSFFGDYSVEIFQPIEVPLGQKAIASVAAETSRVLKQGAGTAILSTASTRTGGTVVEAGELIIRNMESLGVGLLELQAGAKATLQTGYDTVSVTSLILASNSRLEIGTSKLAVAANGFTESDIRSRLITGRNGGSWDGASGITSTFAGGDRSIGYRVADGALEVAFAAPGDGNLDGGFDILDLSEILSAGKFDTGSLANWTQGDTNYDNVFDIVDLADILGTGLFNEGTYLTQGSASSAAVETGAVATFDPALVFAALAMDSGSQPTTKRKSF